MRALIAAGIGLAAALAITAAGMPPGETSPKPLRTTVPSHL